MNKNEISEDWVLVLDGMVRGDLSVADRIKNILEESKSLLSEEDSKEVSSFVKKLEEKYSKRVEEIDGNTSGKTPEDLQKRQIHYRELDRWRVQELFRFARGFLGKKDLIPTPGGEK